MKVTGTRGDEATDCPPNPRVKSCIKCNPNRYDILKITNFCLSNLLKEQRVETELLETGFGRKLGHQNVNLLTRQIRRFDYFLQKLPTPQINPMNFLLNETQ